MANASGIPKFECAYYKEGDALLRPPEGEGSNERQDKSSVAHKKD